MLTRWDPFAEMVSLREAMSHLLNDSVVRPGALAAGTVASFPFDLYESGDDIVVRAAIPGADPNQIEVTVNQGVLTLRGTQQFSNGDQEQGYTWHSRGLRDGNFQLAVSLPMAVNANAAQASYDAGVLTITLPKAEAAKPKRIAVRGGQAQPALTEGATAASH